MRKKTFVNVSEKLYLQKVCVFVKQLLFKCFLSKKTSCHSLLFQSTSKNHVVEVYEDNMTATAPKKFTLTLLTSALLMATATASAADAAPKGATEATKKANEAIAEYLPFSNTQDFD
ncbi:MAG: hypothetical protein WCC56_20440, partial [Erwinia sp.]